MTDPTFHAQPDYTNTLKGVIKICEGFSGVNYNNGNGVPAVGYGFAFLVRGGNVWSLTPNIGLLPVALSAAQTAELNQMIANLNKYGASAETKKMNDLLGNEMAKYAVTASQAETMLTVTSARQYACGPGA